jgi:hypothetical protein
VSNVLRPSTPKENLEDSNLEKDGAKELAPFFQFNHQETPCPEGTKTTEEIRRFTI